MLPSAGPSCLNDAVLLVLPFGLCLQSLVKVEVHGFTWALPVCPLLPSLRWGGSGMRGLLVAHSISCLRVFCSSLNFRWAGSSLLFLQHLCRLQSELILEEQKSGAISNLLRKELGRRQTPALWHAEGWALAELCQCCPHGSPWACVRPFGPALLLPASSWNKAVAVLGVGPAGDAGCRLRRGRCVHSPGFKHGYQTPQGHRLSQDIPWLVPADPGGRPGQGAALPLHDCSHK